MNIFCKVTGLLLLVLLFGCAPSRLTGGSASEGEAKICGRVVYPSNYTISSSSSAKQRNQPTTHISSVKLRSVSFLKDTVSSAYNNNDSQAIDTYTDSNGYFEINGVVPGSYCIEVNDGHSYAAALPVTNDGNADTIILPTDTLRPTGEISGICPTGKTMYVQVYGLDRMTKVDSASGNFIIPYVPKGSYAVRLVFSSPDIPAKTITNINVIPQDITIVPWCSWIFSKQLVFNTTATGADVMSTIVHFPVLVRLSASNFPFNNAAAGGRDLRFTKSDNTPLPFEIERWDAVNKQAEIWVKMDTIHGNNKLQSINMYWGNAGAASASSPSKAFDTADNFQGVWHLADSGISTIKDATANQYNGIRYGTTPPYAASGIIGVSQIFDGATGYIDFPNTAVSSLNFPAQGRYTLSAWVYARELDNAYHQILSMGATQY